MIVHAVYVRTWPRLVGGLSSLLDTSVREDVQAGAVHLAKRDCCRDRNRWLNQVTGALLAYTDQIPMASERRDDDVRFQV